MIKAVFFDLYGTLARFFPPREEVQARACASLGISVTPDGLARGYATADDLMAQVNASQTPMRHHVGVERDQFFARYEQLVLKGAGVAVDLETAARVWAKVQETPIRLALFDDVLAVLGQLKERRLVLGLLSNIDRDIGPLCRELGLTPYLDFALTAQEAGVTKPHPPFFRMALQRAGVQPPEAVHVGDSYLSDVQGARAIGIRPILLDRYGTLGHIADCPRIQALPQLLDFL
ncbi:MAG: HAD-IA family hydrolase [Chloroflexi bacterium]|nr:HAD-IA family hydrolase [Chloroflexota bacterium]